MNTQRRQLRLLGVLLGVGVFAAVLPYRVGVVVGDSMSPSMKSGSLYLVDRTARDTRSIRKGDVVVFKHQGMTYLKRVLAMPGDTVYVLTFPSSGSDEFLMDWEIDNVRRLMRKRRPWFKAKLVERRVPPGNFYAVGDHLAGSIDSRQIGPVPEQNLLGKLLNPPPPQPILNHVAASYVSAPYGPS